jgi:HlyD family secretion protein
MFRKKPKPKIDGDILRFLPDRLVAEHGRASRRTRHVLYLILTCLVCAIFWACVADVDRIVTAQGRLVTTANPLVVQPFEKAIIKSINVVMGSAVKAGETLVILESVFASADMEQLRQRKRSLAANLARLKAELSGCDFEEGKTAACLIQTDQKHSDELDLQLRIFEERRKEYASTLLYYDESIHGLHKKIENNILELKHHAGKLETLAEMEAMIDQVFKIDAAPKMTLLEQRRQRFEASAKVVELQNQNSEIELQIKSLAAQRESYIKKWNSETAKEYVQVKRDMDSVEEELGKAQKKQELVELRAPEDAIVLDVAKLSVGSVATEGRELVSLIPRNAVLEAEVDILPSEVGYVQNGSATRVKLDTLPFQKHGVIDGTVKTISKDIFHKQTAVGDTLVFRAHIELPGDPSADLKDLPPGFLCIPGMTVSAEINVGKRKVIEYFLYPILEGLDTGLREPK